LAPRTRSNWPGLTTSDKPLKSSRLPLVQAKPLSCRPWLMACPTKTDQIQKNPKHNSKKNQLSRRLSRDTAAKTLRVKAG
jgi:hypothetical protein